MCEGTMYVARMVSFEGVSMVGRERTRPKLVNAEEVPRPAVPPRRNRVSLLELAYERIEDLIINCVLKPGQFLALQDLGQLTGFSRTPVHQAVSRLADDTLILVRPRHGLQIAPIDLTRERMLLHLRHDIERFVIGWPPSARVLHTATSSCTWSASCASGAQP